MADKAQPDEHRQQKEDIEDFGTVALTQGAHVIHCLTVIGQVEGHSEAPQGQKTTKYDPCGIRKRAGCVGHAAVRPDREGAPYARDVERTWA